MAVTRFNNMKLPIFEVRTQLQRRRQLLKSPCLSFDFDPLCR
jgi:hypothetical protein